MRDRPPFDPVRAGFYLVGSVLVLYGVVVLGTMVGCAALEHEVAAERFRCDGSRIFDLLGTALSAALAFAGGLMRGGPPPPPPKE
jgi:hypothetical protein